MKHAFSGSSFSLDLGCFATSPAIFSGLGAGSEALLAFDFPTAASGQPTQRHYLLIATVMPSVMLNHIVNVVNL